MALFSPKNVLVTGAAGFIGSHFVKKVLRTHDNIKVISLDKLTYAGSLTNLSEVMTDPRHSFVRGDICDQNLVGLVLREHCIDTIVHFAAESHVDNSIEGPGIFFETNVLGTQILLEAAKHYWFVEKRWDGEKCRFHHISTDEVYGSLSADDLAFTEKSRYEPNSPYSASKAGSDHVVRAYSHTYNVPVTVSNCSNNYGPNQHPEKLIPTVIRCCLEQQTIPIYGDGSNIRDWLYVEDHCAAIERILWQGSIGEVYNIGGDHEVSNLTLAESICHIMDSLYPTQAPHARLISFVEDRLGHDWRYAIDSTKIKKELKWLPSEDHQSFLLKTVKFYVDFFVNSTQ